MTGTDLDRCPTCPTAWIAADLDTCTPCRRADLLITDRPDPDNQLRHTPRATAGAGRNRGRPAPTSTPKEHA